MKKYSKIILLCLTMLLLTACGRSETVVTAKTGDSIELSYPAGYEYKDEHLVGKKDEIQVVFLDSDSFDGTIADYATKTAVKKTEDYLQRKEDTGDKAHPLYIRTGWIKGSSTGYHLSGYSEKALDQVQFSVKKTKEAIDKSTVIKNYNADTTGPLSGNMSLEDFLKYSDEQAEKQTDK